MEFDCSGWATKANLRCSDGRVIMKGAFKHNDGQTVPVVWNHQHNDPNEVLGHALLEDRDEGVYAYVKFNETESGKTAKLLVKHGDVNALSIYANQLKQNMSNVIHGNIREVSLVLAGANPGAFIDSIIMHGEESDEEGIIYTDEYINTSENDEHDLSHSDESKKEDTKVEPETKKTETDNEDEESVVDIYNSLNEKQKDVVNYMIGKALEANGAEDDEEDDEDDDEVKHSEGGNEMKKNVFDNDTEQKGGYLSHSAQQEILNMAKSSTCGSFQAALEMYVEDNALQHADGDPVASSGFVQDTTQDGNVSWLFPEYRDVRPGAPELLTNDQGWVGVVMQKVHKSPISRIRTRHVDIRNIEELRAKGYVKGKKKGIVGNFNLVRRTTDPQTVFVKNALHRDDIIDITDFDYVQYLYNIDRMSLNEELATAILFGDGREAGAEGKIEADKIRPIWLDDDLYTMHVTVDFAAARAELQGTGTGVSFGENYIQAEAMVNTCLYSREKFKGTGTPDMFITPHRLNVMLLARDMNGRRIYGTKAELAAALNVGNIYTVEQMEGKTRKDSKGNTQKLVCLIGNLADYSLGATKGGEITHFTQFDIDFNQQKSLLETRCSGATTRVYSFIAVEEQVASANGGSDSDVEEEVGA